MPESVAFVGQSLGARTAMRMARRMREEGVPVAYVATLDSITDPFGGDELAIALRNGVGGDPFPNGVKANEKAIEALTQFALDQHITPVKYSTGELFATATLGT